MSKKIHIFINDITCSGGTERVASFLANQYVLMGYDTTIVSLLGKPGFSYYPLEPKVKVSYVGSTSFISIMHYLRRNQCDTLISISMGRLSFKISLLKALFRFSFRLILSEHVAYESSSKLIRFLKLVSYQFCDVLVLLTKHDYMLLNDRVRSSTCIIRNASGFSVIDHAQLQKKEKIVLAVGRLTYQKSFDRLLKIWASIDTSHGWKLRIIGDGEDKNKLMQLMMKLNITDSVELIPASKSIDVEYKKASILVMTSRYEGLPLVLIESKSFGLPVVAFDCKTGPKELIETGYDGYLISDGNENDFSDKLSQLIYEDELRHRMQTNALKSSTAYSNDVIFKEWLKLL